jgi:DNA-binding NtrC family response regulator
MRSLAPHAEILVENPFGARQSAWAEAAKRFEGAAVGGAAREALASGDVALAERIVLAAAHLRALEQPDEPRRVLDAAILPADVERGLPHDRGDYLSIAMAAARCRRSLDAIAGASAPMRETRRATWAACFGDSLVHALTLARVIRDHDVLIFGETGTGKEAIANVLQEGALGPDDGTPAPRSALNAAAIPDTLVESELFGHVRGAFTGASETRIGRIRSAHEGCFFLDEVGDLGPTTQVKLLRVIETDEVSPVGSDKSHRANCRYVAATHKDLEAMVESGQFRRDLYQRLAGNVLRLPPLRDRPEDIAEIGRRFVERHLPEGQLEETRGRLFRWLESKEARTYAWPGNVRELQNALRNLLLGLDAGIDSSRARAAPLLGPGDEVPRAILEARAPLETVTDWYLARALAATSQNLAAAARVLGVDRTTVRRHAKRLGLC